jgi:hypothetical protein
LAHISAKKIYLEILKFELMSSLEIIVNSDGIPKEVVEESNRLVARLFGPSIQEFGNSLSETIRLRRYNNQNEIFGQVETLLGDTEAKLNTIPLKVLAPMVDASSYEEDKELQTKWAYLIANALTYDTDIVFNQNCITILNGISSQDAQLLDKVHELLIVRRVERFEKNYKNRVRRQGQTIYESPEDLSAEWFAFGIRKYSAELGYEQRRFEFIISNLVTLGVLKWDIDVQVQAEKASDDPEDKDIEVNVDVSGNVAFVFTALGNKFVTVCKTL